jgi:hypothetical protein
MVLVFFSVLLALGGIAAGFGLRAAAIRGAAEAALLKNEGLISDGVVEKIRRVDNKSSQRRITYTFSTNGYVFRNEIKAPGRFWRGLRVGSPIPVRYARSRPDLNLPSGFELERVPEWIPAPVAVLLAVFSLLLLLPLRGQKRLLEEGRVTAGIVTAHGKAQHGSHGRKTGTQYFYEFTLMSGAVRRGRAIAKAAPEIGTHITVLYDPETSGRNAPYPLPFVRPG